MLSKTNMAFSTSLNVLYPPHGYVIIYVAQNILPGKNNKIPPPPPKPRPYKALAVNGAQRWSVGSVCFARSKKKNKPGKVNVVPTFLVKTRVPSLALAAGWTRKKKLTSWVFFFLPAFGRCSPAFGWCCPSVSGHPAKCPLWDIGTVKGQMKISKFKVPSVRCWNCKRKSLKFLV